MPIRYSSARFSHRGARQRIIEGRLMHKDDALPPVSDPVGERLKAQAKRADQFEPLDATANKVQLRDAAHAAAKIRDSKRKHKKRPKRLPRGARKNIKDHKLV